MNLSKFFRESISLGILGGLLLSVPSFAMDGAQAVGPEDRAAAGQFARRLASAFVDMDDDSMGGLADALSMLFPQDDRDLTQLERDDFVAKFQNIDCDRSCVLKSGDVLKVRFRPLLGTDQDLQELTTLFGETDHDRSQIPLIIKEQSVAIRQTLLFSNKPDKLKWMFSLSLGDGELNPVGFMQITVKGSKIGYNRAASPTAANIGIYQEEKTKALQPVFDTFVREVGERVGIYFGDHSQRSVFDVSIPMDPYQCLNINLLTNVERRLNFLPFEDPRDKSISYVVEPFGKQNVLDKKRVIEFGKSLLRAQKIKYGMSPELTIPEGLQLDRLYCERLSSQNRGLNTPGDFDGLTWLITKKGTLDVAGMMGILTMRKEGRFGLELDPSLHPIAASMGEFFEAMIQARYVVAAYKAQRID